MTGGQQTELRGAEVERHAICAVLWHEDTEAALDLDPSLFHEYRTEWDDLRSFVVDTGEVPQARTIEGEPGALKYEPPYERVSYYVPKLEKLRKWHRIWEANNAALDPLRDDDPDMAEQVLRRALDSLDGEGSEFAKEAARWPDAVRSNAKQAKEGASSLLSQGSERTSGVLAGSFANSLVSQPAMNEAAYYGLAGRFVAEVLPHTEADPVALLLCFLTAFGNLVGPLPHATVSGTDHPARLSVLLVGESGVSRKGTAQDCANLVMKLAAEDWYGESVTSGLTTGEGLIQAVKSSNDDQRRMLWVETEFGRTLTTANREGSTMSAVLRQAWDGSSLSVATRKDALKVPGDHHVSIIGHVTPTELRAKLNNVDLVNGFANRFLFAVVRRSKLLPEGGDLQTRHTTLADIAEGVQNAADKARKITFMRRELAARDLWAKVYPELSSGTDDLAGSMTARGAAQVLRLSVAYALLDGSELITVDHLQAALAVWDFCKASVRAIYEPMPEQAARLLKAIRASMPEGLTTSDQYKPFGGHITGSELSAIRAMLEDAGLIVTRTITTSGRDCRTSYATEPPSPAIPEPAPQPTAYQAYHRPTAPPRPTRLVFNGKAVRNTKRLP